MDKHQRDFLKKKKDRIAKRLESFKGDKSKTKQHWNYLVSRGMMDKYGRQRA